MAASNLLKVSSVFRLFRGPVTIRSSHNLATATYSQALLNLPETKVSVLENGFKVASEYSDSPSSTVGLWIDAGSRFEANDKNGVANFVEHMLFKGTSQKSQRDLELEIQNIGAQFNSYTDREETAIYARCLSSDIPKAVDILADVIKNSKFDQQQIDQEREIISRELDEAESNFKLVAFDYLHLTAYQGTPLSTSVLGPTENIKNFSKEDLEFYVRNNFLAPRMTLVASGDVDHEELSKLAEKHFSSLPTTYTTEIPSIHPCRFTGSEIRARDDWLPFAHVAIAVDTCGHNNPDIYPLMLAKTVIGNWDKTFASGPHTGSRLIHNIQGGQGCHSFEAFHRLYRDTGLWGLHFVVDKMSLDDFMFNLQNEWMRLCINITEKDLEVAKNAFKTNLIEMFDNTTATCADIGRQVLHYDKRTPIAEVNENIQAITVNKFRDVCSKYIYNRCPALAAVGPVEQLPDYVRIRQNMYWLRY